MKDIIAKAFANCKEALSNLESRQQTLERIASLCIESLKKKGKIILMGNGGSAADAQHLAAELVGRFKKERLALAALALSTNTSSLTSIGNDYGFDEVFSRQVAALAKKEDVVIAISTSGNSPNVIKAVSQAKQMGITTIGLLGKNGGALKNEVDLALVVNSDDTPSIQTMHITAGHIICEIIEDSLSS